MSNKNRRERIVARRLTALEEGSDASKLDGRLLNFAAEREAWVECTGCLTPNDARVKIAKLLLRTP